jgi:hypothetical protein
MKITVRIFILLFANISLAFAGDLPTSRPNADVGPTKVFVGFVAYLEALISTTLALKGKKNWLRSWIWYFA